MNWYLYSQLRFPIWLLLAAILVLGVANAQTRISGPLPIVPPSLEASRPSGNSLPGPNSDSIISPDDVLDIYILDVPELSRQYRVSPSGTVQMPLLAHALAGDQAMLGPALDAEMRAEQAADRAFWEPVRRELEAMRFEEARTKRAGIG